MVKHRQYWFIDLKVEEVFEGSLLITLDVQVPPFSKYVPKIKALMRGASKEQVYAMIWHARPIEFLHATPWGKFVYIPKPSGWEDFQPGSVNV